MNVLQHTRNKRNLCLKQNRPDRSYRDTLLIIVEDSAKTYLKLTTRTTPIIQTKGEHRKCKRDKDLL